MKTPGTEQGCIKLFFLSPRGTSGERTEERGTNKDAPPLPCPLLGHPMEEREKAMSLMQPWARSEAKAASLRKPAIGRRAA